MMKKWTDGMSCTRNEYDHLNELVVSINRHLGENIFKLESTSDYESECVDLYQAGDLTCSYFPFEDAILYLEGVEMGVFLKEDLSA